MNTQDNQKVQQSLNKKQLDWQKQVIREEMGTDVK